MHTSPLYIIYIEKKKVRCKTINLQIELTNIKAASVTPLTFEQILN